ncbi:hypothetical protein E2C01_056158 [Portunus trituberculatus]|uniref:Uncharacterized protein n=1 Tax=Portunus trituberculatus TaxID=210409 RepID=A0A5B7GYV5_PORTR|nr:hypothetical protein [Portunus trituberculatus]
MSRLASRGLNRLAQAPTRRSERRGFTTRPRKIPGTEHRASLHLHSIIYLHLTRVGISVSRLSMRQWTINIMTQASLRESCTPDPQDYVGVAAAIVTTL